MWIWLVLIGCGGDPGKDDGGSDPTPLPGDPTPDPSTDCVEEVPYDGIDQDCDGSDLVDVDGDGWDAAVAGGADCDDEAPDVNPGADDTVGNGLDENCDGLDGVDADGDGAASTASGGGDCNDVDPTIGPDAVEIWYDDIDQDCDQRCDHDQDGDGFVVDGYSPPDNSACDTDPQPGVLGYAPDCDDTDVAATDNHLLGTDPVDLAVDVFNLSPITASLSYEEAGASLIVTDASGAVVAGTTAWSGGDLVFTPDGALAEVETFDAELVWSCGTEQWSFTSDVFGSPTSPTGLAGRSYAIDLVVGSWVEPAGIGSLLGSVVDATMLAGVVAADAATLELRLATAEEGTDQQDACVATVDLPPAPFSANPLFAAGPATWSMDVQGFEIELLELELAGAFPPAGDALDAVTLTGTIDTRPLVELISPGGADDAVCLLALAFGAVCTACPDGTGAYCLDLVVEDLVGIEVIGQTLVERTTADIAADPVCP